MQVLPSSKFFTGVLAVLVVGITVYGTYVTLQKREVAESLDAAEIVSSVDVALARDSALTAAASLDTDNDGTPDWQEDLDEAKKVASANTSTASQQLTLTDEFARTFFTNYINTKELGKAITGEAGDAIAMASMDALRGKVADLIPPPLPIQTFQTVEGTPENIRAYGNSVGVILGSSGSTLTESFVTIFDRATRNNDQAEMEKLTPYIEALAIHRDQLLSIKVPEPFVEEHRGFVDNNIRAIIAIQAMRGYFVDPLSSVVGMQLLSAVRDDMSQRMPRIQKLFRDNGVIYTGREPGYVYVMLGQDK
jgi:hypothetical protein